MNKQQVLECIHEVGLSRIAADVERLLTPSIRLTAHAADDAQIPVGASKLGGLPDLPDGAAWPQCQSMTSGEGFWIREQIQGGPLFFLLQLNLADVARFDSENALPHTGMLYFFAAMWKDGFPMDGIEPDCWRVFYYEGERSLLRRTPVPPVSDAVRQLDIPVPIEEQIQSCTLLFEECYVLPRSTLYGMGLTAAENDIVGPMLSDLTYGEEAASSHLLLGNAQEVQSDMRWECEASQLEVSNVWENWHSMSSAEQNQFYADMRKQGGKWRLLLQIDTEPDIRLEWQAYGRGYFWIRKEDLAARNLDNVCLVTQHT